VSRANPSNWEPFDHADLTILTGIYSGKCLNAITSHLGEISREEKWKAQTKVLDIAIRLHFRFHQAKSSTVAQQCAALSQLFKSLNETLVHFAQLDHQSKDKIEDVANRDPQQEDEDRYSGGRERLARTFRAMENLWRWTETSVAEVETKKAPTILRKKQRSEERAAIEDLGACLNNRWSSRSESDS
jgi:hypothetical protein